MRFVPPIELTPHEIEVDKSGSTLAVFSKSAFLNFKPRFALVLLSGKRISNALAGSNLTGVWSALFQLKVNFS